MSSFFALDLERHLGVDGHLQKLRLLLDWDAFRPLLSDVHSDLGRSGYDVVLMLKIMLLQQWHSLSDPGIEHALRVRLDFLQFCDLEVGSAIPDETTICKFRGRLVKLGVFDALLSEVNRQLEGHNIKVKAAGEAIVDATLITANARPRKVMDESGEQQESSADVDATWKKKGKKFHYGYQAFTRCDEDGFIDKTHVTPANESEMKHLETMAEDLPEGTRLRADKGFASADNRQKLKDKKLKSGIMYKAARGRKLTKWQKQFNRLISKTRWRIEQCFGTIKRRFNYQKSSYFSTAKTHAQFTMKAICQNLLKATNMIQINPKTA